MPIRSPSPDAAEPIVAAEAVLPSSALTRAQQLIKARGERSTGARRNVLACLIVADTALSHAEIEARLGNTGLDRVTLYRVLDWAIEQHLIHKVAGFDRAMRFAFNRATQPEAHAHFQCLDCGRTECLDNVPAPRLAVPQGVELKAIELAAHGYCARCAARRTEARESSL